MKKSLIALAAVAASGAAFAQSSVTVYGVVDTSIAVVKGQDTVSGMLNSGARPAVWASAVWKTWAMV